MDAGLRAQIATLDFARAFAELSECAYRVAQSRGWDDSQLSFGDQIAELHGELSEALDAHRRGGFADSYSPGEGGASKPEGVRAELADVLIRLAHVSYSRNFDLGEKVLEKLAYNATRSFRHGGKTL